jgi:hypothetical protein
MRHADKPYYRCLPVNGGHRELEEHLNTRPGPKDYWLSEIVGTPTGYTLVFTKKSAKFLFDERALARKERATARHLAKRGMIKS